MHPFGAADFYLMSPNHTVYHSLHCVYHSNTSPSSDFKSWRFISIYLMKYPLSTLAWLVVSSFLLTVFFLISESQLVVLTIVSFKSSLVFFPVLDLSLLGSLLLTVFHHTLFWNCFIPLFSPDERQIYVLSCDLSSNFQWKHQITHWEFQS